MDLQMLLSGGLGGTVAAAAIKGVAALWGRYNKISDDAVGSKDQTIAVLRDNVVRLEDSLHRLGEKYDALATLRGQEHLRMAATVMRAQSEPPDSADVWEELPTGVRNVVDVVATARATPSKKFVVEESRYSQLRAAVDEKPRDRMPSRRDPREEKD